MSKSHRLGALALGAVLLAGCSSGTVSGNGSASGSTPTPASSSSSSSSAPPSSSAPASSSAAGANNAALAPTDLERAAKTALLSANDFRMKGSGRDGATTIGFDIHYGKDSSDGSMTFGGAQVRLRYAAKTLYMRGASSFWRQVLGADASVPAAQRESVVQLLHDKWVKLPAGTTGLSGIAAIAIRSNFIASALSRPDNAKYTRGPAKTVRGVPTVSFVDSSDGSTVYVPATGTPYPIRIEDTSSSGGTFDLTDWNVPFSAPVPAAGETVTLPH